LDQFNISEGKSLMASWHGGTVSTVNVNGDHF
jgi:hypothetical protein